MSYFSLSLSFFPSSYFTNLLHRYSCRSSPHRRIDLKAHPPEVSFRKGTSEHPMKMWPAPEAIDRQAASKSQAKGSLLSCQSYQIYWSSIISIIQHSRHGYLDNKLITTHTVFSSWPCSTHLLGLFSACIPLTCMETYGNSMKLQCTAVVRLWVSKAESRTRSLPWILMPAVGWRSPEQNLVTLVACCEVGGSQWQTKSSP